MPAFQVLEPAPSFGSQLGQALGGGISQGIGASINQYLQQKQNQRQLSGLAPLFEQLNIPPEGIKQLVQSGIDPALAMNFASQAGARQQKMQEKELGKKEAQGALQNIISNMGQMVAKDLPGIGISATTKLGVNRPGVQNRAMFNSMRSRIESVLVPLVNRGQLSDTRFNFIMGQVPEASDSQRAIVGKLKGLATALSEEGYPVDTSVLEDIPWASETAEAQSGKSDIVDKSHKVKFEPGHDFGNKMPAASELPGAIIRKGNKRYKSNGKTWKQVEG